MSEHVSKTRVCVACDASATLGKRDCQSCGCPEWKWRDGAPPAHLVIARPAAPTNTEDTQNG